MCVRARVCMCVCVGVFSGVQVYLLRIYVVYYALVLENVCLHLVLYNIATYNKLFCQTYLSTHIHMLMNFFAYVLLCDYRHVKTVI